jgi:hypothetical protein
MPSSIGRGADRLEPKTADTLTGLVRITGNEVRREWRRGWEKSPASPRFSGPKSSLCRGHTAPQGSPGALRHNSHANVIIVWHKVPSPGRLLLGHMSEAPYTRATLPHSPHRGLPGDRRAPLRALRDRNGLPGSAGGTLRLSQWHRGPQESANRMAHRAPSGPVGATCKSPGYSVRPSATPCFFGHANGIEPLT